MVSDHQVRDRLVSGQGRKKVSFRPVERERIVSDHQARERLVSGQEREKG